MPDDKLGRCIVFGVLVVIVAGVFITISSIRAWGPVEQAEAERSLWTPVPTWTPAPTPTMHPNLVASKVRAGQAVWICVIIASSFGVLAGMVWVASSVARHVRVTVQVEPQPHVKSLPHNKPALIGSGTIYDARFDTRARLEDVSPPNLEQGQIVLGAECEKLRAIADAIASVMAKQPTDRTCVERRLLEKYGKGNLLEEGTDEITVE